MSAAFRSANLGLRFLLELVALAAIGYWSSRAADPGWLKALLAAAGVVAAAVVWGLFCSPRARWALHPAAKLAVQFGVLGLGGAGLAATGHGAWAIAFLLLTVANALLIPGGGVARADRSA